MEEIAPLRYALSGEARSVLSGSPPISLPSYSRICAREFYELVLEGNVNYFKVLFVCSFIERRIGQNRVEAIKAFLVKDQCFFWFICILVLLNIVTSLVRAF